MPRPYPIGTPGLPWGPTERAAWLAQQQVRRSYAEEVLAKLPALRERFEVVQYGTLPYAPDPYPLFGLRSRGWSPGRPKALITGGVHGYETSGVQGALRFAEAAAQRYAGQVDLAIAPCISPWGYETINRWNPHAIDPNRSFVADSPAAECRALMAWVASLPDAFDLHIDLHETTDTDNSEFRPAKAARDGTDTFESDIPDGFYLVGRTDRPVPAFQAAIRDNVAQVTHIAAADAHGRIIGVPLEQEGIINYDAVALGLCMGLTDAAYTTTTEVYPDSPSASPEQCIRAQVAAITGALDHQLRQAGRPVPPTPHVH
ncbi:MAG: hypothetical protein ACI8PZ_003829 [Myxococcota bacterium]|jgi:hypothetical protein